jgi:lipoprotein-anchoring transpeptidase ErfK/SrfK
LAVSFIYFEKQINKISTNDISNEENIAEEANVNTNTNDISKTGTTNSNTIVATSKINIIKFGDNSEDVIHIQERLNEFGYNLTVDGAFGNQTYNAVRDFQTRLSLTIDGVVGEETLARLNEEPTAETMYTETNFDSFNSEDKDTLEGFMNSNNFFSNTNYFIVTNLADKTVNIFQGSINNWTLLNQFQCTIGTPDTPTITGRYRVGSKGYSFGHEKGYECRYYTQISGNYLFHSILFNLDGSILDDRLGYELSHGCIRLAEENAKWIYDNIPQNTEILIR